MKFNFKTPTTVREEYLYAPFREFRFDRLRRRRLAKKIKIVQAKTGMGKTHGMVNIFIPDIFKEDILQNVSLVVIAVPNLENIDTITFQEAARDNGYIYTENITEADSHLKRGSKVAFAATHGKIALNKECSSILLKYSKTSAWFVDEAHTWLGVTEKEYYEPVMGYTPPKFEGTVFKFLSKVLQGTDLVFGITATPTKQHRQCIGPIEFEIINEWCPVSESAFLTKWSSEYKMYKGFDMVKKGYKTVAQIDRNSAKSALRNYIRHHHVRNILENERLQSFDSNVSPKLSSIIACGGDNNTRLAIHMDEVLEWLYEMLPLNGYNYSGFWIAVMRDKQKGFFNLNGDFEPATESQIIEALNDPENDAQFLLINQKGKAGINVFNLTGICSLRIRDPKRSDVTELSKQIIGRLSRLNSGHGNTLKEHYNYDLELMCKNYCADFGVDPKVFYETVINNNSFQFCYPSTPKNQWELSVDEFDKFYTARLSDIDPYLRSIILDDDSGIQLCPECGQPINSSHDHKFKKSVDLTEFMEIHDF